LAFVDQNDQVGIARTSRADQLLLRKHQRPRKRLEFSRDLESQGDTTYGISNQLEFIQGRISSVGRVPMGLISKIILLSADIELDSSPLLADF
jgi:hypothetical protein